MNYDAASKQITFAHMLTNALYSLKETTIPALSTMIITAKFKGTICDSANPVATIHAPNNPTISGMPALVTLDKYKHLFSRNSYVCPIWILIIDTDQAQINSATVPKIQNILVPKRQRRKT